LKKQRVSISTKLGFTDDNGWGGGGEPGGMWSVWDGDGRHSHCGNVRRWAEQKVRWTETKKLMLWGGGCRATHDYRQKLLEKVKKREEKHFGLLENGILQCKGYVKKK